MRNRASGSKGISPRRCATTGTGVPIPFSLYPDYDRRPRNHTGSADLAGQACKRSRAMRGLRNYRRWGIAPRPENVATERRRRRIISTYVKQTYRLLTIFLRMNGISSGKPCQFHLASPVIRDQLKVAERPIDGFYSINTLHPSLRPDIMRPFAVVSSI